jgi:predicted acyltransferase
MNAITAYVFSEVLSGLGGFIHVSPHIGLDAWIYGHVFAIVPPPGLASLLYSICFMLICWIPVAILYRRKIFIRV